ncbi:hypothetical protein PT974_08463 [Cladobotryum mycophilum]|uniref:Amidohydrolase-related domain-containing protein n=1 Tax=Cladobotryum mycophilum TaxID=491253 RepID=A0ABR0SED3_9HYPO
MEKQGQRLPPSASAPSPSDQASAYPRRRLTRGGSIRSLSSVRTLLKVIIAGSVIWLAYALRRQTGSKTASSGDVSSSLLLHQFEESLTQCEGLTKFPARSDPSSRTSNPRWSPKSGQKKTVILRNATLFDGESFLPHAVDVVFSKGIIESVSKTSDKVSRPHAVEYNLHGRYVTPGLVDMHSHHLALVWPTMETSDDTNEMHVETKAIAPMLRVVDGLKPYDTATILIASGGVTSSLILPGSANLLGGEAVPVKNALYSGENAEPVVEDLLLECGIPLSERRRYMKIGFGESPKNTWGYTRLGTAWHLRDHLQRAKEFNEEQDTYCIAISEARSWDDLRKTAFVRQSGRFPFQLKLDTITRALRGRFIIHNHNYEAEDLETMLRISHEFGFRIWGFHHATDAWRVPNMLKQQGGDVMVALFAEFSLYTAEAYSPNLYSGYILDKNGISVAYKSDHCDEITNAKYLISQAAIGHAFHHSEEKALQAVTSIPAKAIDLDFRIGYCRLGFDADIVVWNSHPLTLGATPLQVFIDGRAQLDQSKVEKSLGTTFTSPPSGDAEHNLGPQVRFEPKESERVEMCTQAYRPKQSFIIDGIRKAFLDNYPELSVSLAHYQDRPLRLVVVDGAVACLGPADSCAEATKALEANETRAVHISLQNGYLLPGLTAVTRALGMKEIAVLGSTGDGQAADQKIGDPDSLVYAKYGIWLDGKHFARARLGGVTRAVTPPLGDASGFVGGVSVEILTSGKKSLIDGGIVQGEVGLHLFLGEATKTSEGSISSGVQHLRKMLKDGKGKLNDTLYGQVAAGELPLVVYCNNRYDMMQLVLVKKDFPETNIVILGGKESPYVAKDLAAAKISVILSENRPAPDHFRDKDAVVGPPLTRSVASYLKEAGVTFALTIFESALPMDYRLHGLGPEAGWAAKYAGLGEEESVRLVSTNVESILGLKKSRDLVVFEGSPMRYGASVVVAFHADDKTGKLEVSTCFPREDEFEVGTILK